MRLTRLAPGLLAVLLLAIAAAGCSDKASPEERVRTFVDKVARSAEERSWVAFKGSLYI